VIVSRGNCHLIKNSLKHCFCLVWLCHFLCLKSFQVDFFHQFFVPKSPTVSNIDGFLCLSGVAGIQERKLFWCLINPFVLIRGNPALPLGVCRRSCVCRSAEMSRSPSGARRGKRWRSEKTAGWGRLFTRRPHQCCRQPMIIQTWGLYWFSIMNIKCLIAVYIGLFHVLISVSCLICETKSSLATTALTGGAAGRCKLSTFQENCSVFKQKLEFRD